jgi:hypothetical protein
VPAEPDLESAPAAVPIDFASFQSAWPVIVSRVRDDAGPRRHALLKEARPMGVRDAQVILEVPADLHFHLEQLRADVELHRVVASIAADVLGNDVAFTFEPADGDAPGSDTLDLDPPAAPDPSELLEEGDDATDPTALVVDMLGGEVVSD